MRDADFVSAVDELEDLLFQVDKPFSIPVSDAAKMRDTFSAKAFDTHLAGNPDYRRFAAASGVTSDQVHAGGADVVPLVPSSVFKHREVLTTPLDGEPRRCTSSGTQGGLSVVYRDRRTLQRFLGSIGAAMEVLDLTGARPTQLHVLGPDTAEAGDLWFSYVLSIVDLVHPTTFHVEDGRFRIDQLLARLGDREQGVRPVLIGPPVLLQELAERARGAGIALGADDGMAVTAGGWKRASGASVPRAELIDLTVEAFGLSGPERVRDCFNMVELNTVIAECREHRMHIPPWLRVTARNPANLAVLPDGETGMLAFVDPLPTSYPGFVIGDDLGRVHYGVECACGRTSDVMVIERRLRRVESRGCALKLDQAVAR